ncbi:uncharacterized protein Dana_GF11560 [Drosophila ananassae]|uniref:Uncharacterized protein n=1 Tax=Drosophila ananassae TaxID=7217 RepID=B3MBN8_DROAN|nr:uncharacterized protein LOC6494424 [Drosophila ananassae]EDV37169.1 uncharacterized protein Dana_GF11560 [Drosophila ananassae]
MADPDLEMTVKPAPGPIGGVATHYNLDNERLDCDNLDETTERYIDYNRPSFFTVIMRFFGNIFVDVFNTILN